MSKMYIGVNNTPKEISKVYIGVNGVAKEVLKIYIGVNGVAKECFVYVEPNYTALTVTDAGTYTLNIYKEDTQPTEFYLNNVLSTTSTTSGTQDISITTTTPNSVIKIKSDGNWYFDSYCLGSSSKDSKLSSINTDNETKMTSVGVATFDSCSALSSITIPDSVTTINSRAFQYSYNLTSLNIPENVSSIGVNIIRGCTNLGELTVDSNNNTYHSNGDCIIKTSTNELVTGCKNSVIPSDGSVTSISNYAFNNCVGLTSVDIPSAVTSIGTNVFENCTYLSTINEKNNTPPTLGADSIPSTISTIYIPSGSLTAYQNATNWSAYSSKFIEY